MGGVALRLSVMAYFPKKVGVLCMARPYKEAARRLYETAQTQQGFFTTKQAIRAGLAQKTHAYHVKAGNWVRVHRGIYRLADFPPGGRPDLMLWYLWAQNRKEIPEGTKNTKHPRACPNSRASCLRNCT